MGVILISVGGVAIIAAGARIMLRVNRADQQKVERLRDDWGVSGRDKPWIYADLFDSDLDAVGVNLDTRIADSVRSTRRPSSQADESRRLAGSTVSSVECPRGDLNPHAR